MKAWSFIALLEFCGISLEIKDSAVQLQDVRVSGNFRFFFLKKNSSDPFGPWGLCPKNITMYEYFVPVTRKVWRPIPPP